MNKIPNNSHQGPAASAASGENKVEFWPAKDCLLAFLRSRSRCVLTYLFTFTATAFLAGPCHPKYESNNQQSPREPLLPRHMVRWLRPGTCLLALGHFGQFNCQGIIIFPKPWVFPQKFWFLLKHNWVPCRGVMIPAVESIPESDFGHFLEFWFRFQLHSAIELIPIWNWFQ